VAQPVFDAGLRRAEIEAAKARFREAAAVLTDSVLSSIKEVEDALSLIQTQKERCKLCSAERKRFCSHHNIERRSACGRMQDLITVFKHRKISFKQNEPDCLRISIFRWELFLS